MSLATLNGVTVSRLSAIVPAWGAWWADVDTTEGTLFEKGSAATLKLGGVTMLGTIVAGGVVDGRGAYRVVGGKGKWGASIKGKPYLDDAGVKLSRVLLDAAKDAGETLGSALPTTRLGSHYVRRADPAYLTLNQLAPKGWYVDFAGVTQIGKRSSSSYSGDAPRTRIDGRVEVIELATDSVVGLVPGVTVDSTTAQDVEYVLEESRLTVRLYAVSSVNGRLEAMRDIVLGLFPVLRFGGHWEYRVVGPAGDRYNLQAHRTVTGMPDLARVPVRGTNGVKATLRPGSLVLVVFADNDPSRPQIVAQDAVGGPGWLPLDVTIGLAGVPIAYQGSLAQCGPFAGAVAVGSSLGRVQP